MKTYPCFLKSKVTGTTYRFDEPGLYGFVVELGENSPSFVKVSDKRVCIGWHPNDPNRWSMVVQLMLQTTQPKLVIRKTTYDLRM
jgi:hypothetical protein